MYELCEDCAKIEKAKSEKIREITKVNPNAYRDGEIDHLVLRPEELCLICEQEFMAQMHQVLDRVLVRIKLSE